MITCEWCDNAVFPEKNALNLFVLIVLLIIFFPAAIVYAIYWAALPSTICPLCHWDVYGRTPTGWLEQLRQTYGENDDAALRQWREENQQAAKLRAWQAKWR